MDWELVVQLLLHHTNQRSCHMASLKSSQVQVFASVTAQAACNTWSAGSCQLLQEDCKQTIACRTSSAWPHTSAVHQLLGMLLAPAALWPQPWVAASTTQNTDHSESMSPIPLKHVWSLTDSLSSLTACHFKQTLMISLSLPSISPHYRIQLSLIHYLRFPPTREITLNVSIASLVPPGSPRPPPSTTTHSSSHVRVRVTVSQQQRYVRDPWHGQFTSFLCIYYLLLSCYSSSSLFCFVFLFWFILNQMLQT